MTFIDNLKIYEINLVKYKEFCYNNVINKSIIAMIDMSYEELLKVKGDKLMERLKDEERLLKNSYIQDGYEKGIKQNTILLTKNMLKENIDIEQISKITGLSIEEIEKLK